MLTVYQHINNLEKVELKLSEELICDDKTTYRTLYIGNELVIFINDEQLEKLFDIIDEKIHKRTYVKLEDDLYATEVTLEEADKIIEMYRECQEGRR